jgi:hypothetical protein
VVATTDTSDLISAGAWAWAWRMADSASVVAARSLTGSLATASSVENFSV